MTNYLNEFMQNEVETSENSEISNEKEVILDENRKLLIEEVKNEDSNEHLTDTDNSILSNCSIKIEIVQNISEKQNRNEFYDTDVGLSNFNEFKKKNRIKDVIVKKQKKTPKKYSQEFLKRLQV